MWLEPNAFAADLRQGGHAVLLTLSNDLWRLVTYLRASWPGLTRPSSSKDHQTYKVTASRIDGRLKGGHDRQRVFASHITSLVSGNAARQLNQPAVGPQAKSKQKCGYITNRVCGKAACQPNQKARWAGRRDSCRPPSAVSASSDRVHVPPLASVSVRSPS